MKMPEPLLIAALIGTTLIVVRGTIVGPIRRVWPAFFQCSQCVGFWVGVGGGASGLVEVGHGRGVDAAIVGTATSFLSLLADAVLLRLLGDPSEGAP
jgi:hypothetical protein